MAVIKAVSGGVASINGIYRYLTQVGKTAESLVSGIRCSSDNPVFDMNQTKIFYEKKGGRQYKHFVQSFSPTEEVTPEIAHSIAVKLVQQVSIFSGFECLIVTHIDTEHLHSHIIVNSVSIVDGHKFRYSKKELADLKKISDTICIENNLSIIDVSIPELKRQIEYPVSYDQYTHAILKEADKGNFDSWIYEIAEKIIVAKNNSIDKKTFETELIKLGIRVEWNDNRKHIVYQIKLTDGTKKKIRGSTLEKYFHIAFDKENLIDEFGEKTEQLNRADRVFKGSDELLSRYLTRYASSHRSAKCNAEKNHYRKGRSR